MRKRNNGSAATKKSISRVREGNWDTLSTLQYRQLTPHAVRLAHERFQRVGDQQEWRQNRCVKNEVLEGLLYQQVQHKAAERMYK